MNEDYTVQFPEEFRNIPASCFAFNPGAQAVLAGFIILDVMAKAKIRRRIAGAIVVGLAAIWAFVHPEKCHKTTWREHWGRQWMFD